MILLFILRYVPEICWHLSIAAGMKLTHRNMNFNKYMSFIIIKYINNKKKEEENISKQISRQYLDIMFLRKCYISFLGGWAMVETCFSRNFLC